MSSKFIHGEIAMKKLSLALLLTLSISAHGIVGVGTLTPFFGTYQKDLDGSSENLFSLNPYITLNEQFRMVGSHLFVPEFGFVLPDSSTDSGDASKRSMIFILWNFAWEMFPNFNLKYGVGTFWTRISGDGGQITTPNGTGTTTAFLPNDSVKSYNSTINLGLEVKLRPRLSGKLEIYTWEPFDSDGRRFNIALGANYYLQ